MQARPPPLPTSRTLPPTGTASRAIRCEIESAISSPTVNIATGCAHGGSEAWLEDRVGDRPGRQVGTPSVEQGCGVGGIGSGGGHAHDGSRYRGHVAQPDDTLPAEHEPLPVPAPRHPFALLLGGVRGGLESVLPPLVFITVYVALGGDADTDLTWAIISAVTLGLGFTAWRLLEGKHPARAVGSLLVVLLSAYIAARTGSAEAFFWPRVLLNAVSALAFVLGNLVRWPLIGVVVGSLSGTRMAWRRDPDLLRAYTRASWPWAGLNLLRTVLLMVFIDGNALWALAVSGAFFYAMTLGVIAWSLVHHQAEPAPRPPRHPPSARPPLKQPHPPPAHTPPPHTHTPVEWALVAAAKAVWAETSALSTG